MYNDTFYPITDELVEKMFELISSQDGFPGRILDPSAGRGDLLEKLQKKSDRGGWNRSLFDKNSFYAIEKDNDLQAILRSRGYKVLDSDFLTFSGPDKFDLIVMNPPFDMGAEHLLKAIDVMYHGQIICLLNAETLNNLCTNYRKMLAQKLVDLGATCISLDQPFKHAERKTNVSVALVNIIIENEIESELFDGIETDNAKIEVDPDQDGASNEILSANRIAGLVESHDDTVTVATRTILDFYRNYPKIHRYIGLNQEPKSYSSSAETLTILVQATLNSTVSAIRTDYWRDVLQLPEVRSRLTQKKAEEFEHRVSEQYHMTFTEANIRQFVLNLIGGYKDSLIEAVLALFKKMTFEHSWDGNNVNEKNIHYFNGWKTNKAFYVNKRIVMPFYASYGGPFIDFDRWKLDWSVVPKLNDIDIVMNYFDGMNSHYHSIADALKKAFDRGENSTSSTFFSKLKAHKKGTLHLTFRNDDILRRFNIEACKGKGWLPQDYGAKPYKELDSDHRAVVDSFEGERVYNRKRLQIGFKMKDLVQIKAPEADEPTQMKVFN